MTTGYMLGHGLTAVHYPGLAEFRMSFGSCRAALPNISAKGTTARCFLRPNAMRNRRAALRLYPAEGIAMVASISRTALHVSSASAGAPAASKAFAVRSSSMIARDTIWFACSPAESDAVRRPRKALLNAVDVDAPS